MKVAVAWALLLLVLLQAQFVRAAIPHTWRPGLRLVVGSLVTFVPAVFVGWALHVFGVQLLGGAS